MKTLWQKGADAPESTWFWHFSTDEDRTYDKTLIHNEILINLAHVEVLATMHLVSAEEGKLLTDTLHTLLSEAKKGEFTVSEEDEDVHSTLEKRLSKECGSVGAKIHAFRSRNDLILTNVFIEYRSKILRLTHLLAEFYELLLSKAKAFANIPIPGYTHTQPAMPSSGGLWLSGYLDLFYTFTEDIRHHYSKFTCLPLGSAAGFGVPGAELPLSIYARHLGFTTVGAPATRHQLSRGLVEQALIGSLSHLAQLCNRLASDCIFYAGQRPCWLVLSDEQTSGSSIMPQKRNPDAWELIRGYSHRLSGIQAELTHSTQNLISGYHRDLQRIKALTLDAFSITETLVTVITHTVDGMTIDAKKARESITPEMVATHLANSYVLKGIPFRDAYKKAAKEFPGLTESEITEFLSLPQTQGAPFNIPWNALEDKQKSLHDWMKNTTNTRELE